MPRVGFEPMITASERAKKLHALDRSEGTSQPTYRRASYKFNIRKYKLFIYKCNKDIPEIDSIENAHRSTTLHVMFVVY
jgi:hypothetical protein